MIARRLKRTPFALAVLLAAAGPAVAQEGPQSLTCSFTTGSVTSYEKGAFASQTPAPLSFEIAGIDLEGQNARLVTESGNAPGTLRIVRAINANHFLEVVNEGFLNLTTVYDKDAATGTYPAVHSRHLGLLGQPVFAQYSGFCRDK